MACQNPIRLKRNSKIDWVPCGNCPQCIIEQQEQWIFRMQQEQKATKGQTRFVTLTYDEENLPISTCKDTGETNGTLYYPDVQNYMKRLRKAYKGKMKHFTVGEYGDEKGRPHYHQVLFNAPDNRTIKKAWSNGIITSDQISLGRMRYVCKYMGKRIENTPNGAEKPKRIMSNGLGLSFIENEKVVKHHKSNLKPKYKKEGGKEIPLPRYIKEKIFTEEEKRKIRIRNEIQSEKDLEDLWKKYSTPKELQEELLKRVREKDINTAYLERMLQKKSKSK